VLTSTITRSKPDWKIAGSHRDGVASMPLSRIAAPTLIMSHRHDACDITPAADAPKLKSRLIRAGRVEVAVLDGGDPPVEALRGEIAARYFIEARPSIRSRDSSKPTVADAPQG
jgi:hypothetical protein